MVVLPLSQGQVPVNTTVACVMGLCRQVTTHNHNVRQLAPLRILEILVSDSALRPYSILYRVRSPPESRLSKIALLC